MTMGEWREEDPGNVSPENLEESMRCLSIKNNEGGQNQNAEISHYPDRPDEPNCSYFMRTGQCGYGSRCRFNHPAILGKEVQCGGKLQEKAGQPNCQFFLKTGTCKYGPSCKYHHPHDKLMPLLNKLGLPMRQDEKPCPYYVRNGSCKFGFACKFHHPEPVSGTIIREENQLSQGVLPLMGGTPSWMPVQQSLYLTAQGSPGFSSFIPVMFSPTHNLTTGQQAWGVYAGGTNFQEFYRPEHLQEDSNSSVPAVLPERPDQPECQYFLKTGRCKYGPVCKYHHPRERIDSFSIGPHMLPLRPGQAVCTFYASYGSCKYGSACKFDHPYVWTGYSPGYPAYPSLSSWDASSSSSSLFPFEGIPPMDMTSLSISAADDPPAISPALDHSD